MNAGSEPTVLLEGPAYGVPFRVGAVVIALTLGFAMWVLYRRGDFASEMSTGVGWFIAGFALVCLFAVTIVRSRTRVERRMEDDPRGDVLVQTWLGDKRAAVAEISHARFIYYPAFAWLVAPRLVLVLASGKITAIYVATQRLYEYAADIEKMARSG